MFDYSYEDIAKTVGKSVPNCRQVARRARQHLIIRKPRAEASSQQKTQVVEHLLESWQQGDFGKLIELMAEDVVFCSDGGGKATAALYPLEGSQKVARFLLALRRSRLIPPLTSQITCINGQPSIANTVEGHLQSIFSFEFKGSLCSS